jgi:Helix-turn-helix
MAANLKLSNGANGAAPALARLATAAPKRVDPMEQALFRQRLRESLAGRSVNSFAKLVPVSQSVMRQYLIGESEPTRPVVLAIARAAGVSPAWLAFGTGSPSG